MKAIAIGNLSQNNVLIIWIKVIVGRAEAGHEYRQEEQGDRRVSTELRHAHRSDGNEQKI